VLSLTDDLRMIDGDFPRSQGTLSEFSPLEGPSQFSQLDRFRDQHSGYVSLGLVRTYLDLQDPFELGPLMDSYSEWLLDDLGLVFKKTTMKWDQTPNWTGEPHFTSTDSFRYSKARKRGNDMDAYRIRHRMKQLRDGILPYCESEDHLKNTRALYVTLTVDPRMTGGDLESAWLHVGRWFNDFRSRLAKTFGTTIAEDRDGEFVSRFCPCRIHLVRSWEAHSEGPHLGWPHVHAVLCFEDFKFGIFQDAKFRWRAKAKKYLDEEGKERDRFQDAWPYGFADVVAMTPGTLERELDNVLWYVAKNLSSQDYRLVRSWPQKKRLTQSILWYLGSRSFSVSRRLLEKPPDAEPADLIQRTSITQNRLDGEGFTTEANWWTFLGLIPRTATELGREDWEKEYAEPPDWVLRWLEPLSSQFESSLPPVGPGMVRRLRSKIYGYHPPWGV